MLGISCSGFSQINDNRFRHKIAVFAPLFLDSAFNGAVYKQGETFPRYILPGVEFYEGLQLALDSMNAEGVPLEVFFYDTKAKRIPFSQQLRDLPQVELIIGAVSGSEVVALAHLANTRNIPFISATFPNEAGVVNNPNFVVLNPTLPVHVAKMYHSIQQFPGKKQVVYFRRKDSKDQWLKNLFTETTAQITGTVVPVKYVELDDIFTAEDLALQLADGTTNLCIAGSMDEQFNKYLAEQLAINNKTYPAKLYGFPVWDSYKDLDNAVFQDLEINYTVPLYNPRTDKVSISITDLYRDHYYARPSDMVFWGYGAIWKYARLLLEYGADITGNIAVDKFDIFTDLDVQPVLNKQTDTLDYFENKRVTLLQVVNGEVTVRK